MKCVSLSGFNKYQCLPPHGGSGLKFRSSSFNEGLLSSPSARREWIEITIYGININDLSGLPPHGGSGLKFAGLLLRTLDSSSPSARREWIEIKDSKSVTNSHTSLPPHGGSGLKFRSIIPEAYYHTVSLRTEGVD